MEERMTSDGLEGLPGADDRLGQNRTLAAEDEELQKTMEFVFEGILILGVGIIGIIGNTCALYLFSRKQLQMKFHRLMLMLASFDNLYCLLSILLFAIPQVDKDFVNGGAHAFLLPVALPMAQIALTGSIYSTLAVTGNTLSLKDMF